MKPSKPYEEVQITPTLIWRWVREGDEYVMRISEMALEAHKAHIEAALAQPEHPLDRKATNARELGLDYEPEQDHGFDRTGSHMAGEYVDTAGTEHQFKYMFYGLRADENGMFSIGEISQREWVGLTDDEIAEIENEYIVDYRIPAGSAWNFAKAIEAKLKEKNG